MSKELNELKSWLWSLDMMAMLHKSCEGDEMAASVVSAEDHEGVKKGLCDLKMRLKELGYNADAVIRIWRENFELSREKYVEKRRKEERLEKVGFRIEDIKSILDGSKN